MKKLVSSLVCVAALAAPALHADDSSSFELGGGVAYQNPQSDVRPAAMAIVQMRVNSLKPMGSGVDIAVGPKIDVQIGFGSDGVLPTVPHADIAATLARVPTSMEGSSFAGYEGLTINYQREVAIDLGHTLTVSLAGAWVDARMPLTPAIKLMVKGLIDVASVGYAKRLGAKSGEIENIVGWTPNFDGEIGIEILDRFRIVLGERAIYAIGATTGTVFGSEDQPKGNGSAFISRTSAKVAVDVLRNFQVFAEGSYSIFAFDARPDAVTTPGGLLGGGVTTQGDDVHGEKGVWQVLVGAGGRF